MLPNNSLQRTALRAAADAGRSTQYTAATPGGWMAILKPGVDADYVLAALLRHHLFPAHKSDLSELPGCFSSAQLSDQVARDLANSGGRGNGCGYDFVRYQSTRFNNVPRTLAIPHPVPHSRLALCIHDNWNEIKRIRSNRHSFIRPRLYPDGRLFTMDYESGAKRVSKELKRAFAKRFLVRADISNCYPSIYTHSIAWAAVGKPEAKAKRFDKTAWFNELDLRVRDAKRNETHGIVIGPATSSIIAEFILGKVDAALAPEFAHARFVDDFQAFCETEEEAQRFIRRLTEELRAFELELNARKTSITPLPHNSSPDWIHELSLWAPKRQPALTVYDITNYLDLALNMSAREPDGSVLKYAVKTLCGTRKKPEALFALISYTLNLAFHNPVLVPLLDGMFDEMATLGLPLAYGESIERLISRFADMRSSDGLAWGLAYAERHGLKVGRELGSKVIASGDCLSMSMLMRVGDGDVQGLLLDCANSIVAGAPNEVDKYDLDQHWVLLYELFADGRLANPYANESAFEILEAAGVRFVV